MKRVLIDSHQNAFAVNQNEFALYLGHNPCLLQYMFRKPDTAARISYHLAYRGHAGAPQFIDTGQFRALDIGRIYVTQGWTSITFKAAILAAT